MVRVAFVWGWRELVGVGAKDLDLRSPSRVTAGGSLSGSVRDSVRESAKGLTRRLVGLVGGHAGGLVGGLVGVLVEELVKELVGGLVGGIVGGCHVVLRSSSAWVTWYQSSTRLDSAAPPS